MPDKLTPEQRHKNMAAIKSRNTRPELIVRRFLHAHGYRYRLNVKKLPASPDIVLRRLHTVVLVNGCFWHGHKIAVGEVQMGSGVSEVQELSNSECCKIPKTNRGYWLTKIVRNKERDERDRAELRRLGWNVIQIWECELKPAMRESKLQSLLLTLSKIELSLAAKKNSVCYELGDDRRGVMVADESMPDV